MMFRPLSKSAVTASEGVSGKGGSDALLKALHDSCLDVWTALRLLHENTHPGVQGYICNRLPELGEAVIEQYLLQLVYLAVSKPGQQLERILLTLCKHSFRVAIKAQWLLVALCQDHSKSKALESFRDQAYKAALEGKWEVPIRTAKLDPLSPNTSQYLSPPLCSPSYSYMAAHLASANHINREALSSQPYRGDYHPDDAVATQPPGSMVMSPPGGPGYAGPPGAGGSAACVDGGGGGGPAALQRKRSGAMQTLACLLPADQRGGITNPEVADGAQQQRQQQQLKEGLDASGGMSSSSWLDDGDLAAIAPAIKTAGACATLTPTPIGNGGLVPPPSAAAAATSRGASTAKVFAGCQAVAAFQPPVIAAATAGPVAPAAVAEPAPGPTGAIPVDSTPAAAAGAIAVAAGCVQATLATPGGPAALVGAAEAAETAEAAVMVVTGAGSGGGGSIAERIQALKRELGEGEGVSALLERAKQQGMAPVAAMEDDVLFSDDELSNRPMSPLSRLRFDTFGATLDFVEALCDASSSLTNYSQEVRQNALREALEHINHEIERANRREVAIWFPMGRRGDRVLRLAAREAVLLNSREKAPFLLIVEVLEGQNECGDSRDGVDAFAGLSAGASVKAHLDSLGGIAGGGLSASMMAPSTGLKLEYGRRETYGIALTGIGAQHQLHYMQAAPGVGGGTAAAAAAAKATAATAAAAAAGRQLSGPDQRRLQTQPHIAAGGLAAPAAAKGPPASTRPSLSRDTAAAAAAVSSATATTIAAGESAAAAVSSATATTIAAGESAAAVAAARPVPVRLPNGCSSSLHGRSDAPLVSPKPQRPTLAMHAALLEERATAAAATAANPSHSDTAEVEVEVRGLTSNLVRQGSISSAGACQAPSTGVAGPGPSLAPSPGLGPAALQQAAMEIVIPTRSASSSNIAAAAAATPATAAAMLTSASGGGTVADSIFLASDRSSDAGTVGTGCTGAIANGSCILTPRSGSSPSTGLPPRPPPPPALLAPPPLQHPQPLPVGGISPVNAAKEVSASGGGQEGGGLLAASNLLRRVFGDRAEVATGSVEDVPCPAGAGSVVRTLDGKFSSMEAPRWGPSIASAAAASNAVASPAPAAAAAAAASIKSFPFMQQGPSASVAAGCADTVAARQAAAALSHWAGAHPTGGKQQELAFPGRYGPQPSATRSGPEVMAMLSDISATLRGEMPRVRVRIVPVGPGDVATAAAAPAPAAGGNGSAIGSSSGSGATAFSLATLGSRAKAALLNQQQPQLQPPQQAASDDAVEGGQSKTALLLSRLGWCRKPAAEDDAGDAGAGAGAATAAATSGAVATPDAHGTASQVTIPVTCGGSATAKRLPGANTRGSNPPLVRLVLIVATQGVNLDIKSPYRKSRRTPSHEAIERMAGKYKIQKLPPPPECGPPLVPGLYGSSASSMAAMDHVLERENDEGEGDAALAVEEAAATQHPPTDERKGAALKSADASVWPWMRSIASSAPESSSLSFSPSSLPRAATAAAVAAIPTAVGTGKLAVLHPPLLPGWESRCVAAAVSTPAVQSAAAVPRSWTSSPSIHGSHREATVTAQQHEEASSPLSLPAVSPQQQSHPEEYLECKSAPTAVSEAAIAMAADSAGAPQPIVLLQALSGDGHVSMQPTGFSPSEKPEAAMAPCLEKATALETGVAAAPTPTPAPAGGGGLAASLQSSLTRILHRSAAAGVQQQQAPSDAAPAVSALGSAVGGSSSSGSQPTQALLQAAAATGGLCTVAAPLSARQPPAVPVAIAATDAAVPEATTWRAPRTDAAGVDAGAKVQPQPQPQTRTEAPASAEAGGAAVAPPAGGGGLAASLQSSLTRILSRSAMGPGATQQQQQQQQALTPDQSLIFSAAPNGASATALRGVSPIRDSVGGGDGGSQFQAPAVAMAAEQPAAEGDGGKGPSPQPPPLQQQQQQHRTTVQEGAPVASPASSGLAASLQSSLTRILNRSAGSGSQQQPQHQQYPQHQQPVAEGAAPAAAGGGSSATAPGPSPRGVSPVRGNAAGSTSGGGGTLSKLLSRMQMEQQQQQQQQQLLLLLQQQPPSSLLNQNIAPGAQQQQHQPHRPAQPSQQQQLQQAVHGRAWSMQQGRLSLQVPGTELAAAPPPLQQQLPSYGVPKVTEGRFERDSLEERRRREANAVYGERWAAKVRRIQRESPHGRRQGWALRCVIVKSGDDCRQELLALQLVRTLGNIFADAGLPLWVRYYEVLVTSNKTALIEMVPNTLSIHTIKSRSPPGTSLSDHFFAKFGRSGSPECTAAQRRFTESLAAYSLICYLLQIKDRHNGNILIDDDGHVVHIDYGFLLSNSPGGVNFESAPFKLTRELLEVMDSNSDGRPSEMFDYFKVLMIQGFIAAHNCSDRIMMLVKVMAKSGFPCFKGGERALKALEKRLMTSLSEVQCVEHVLQLIAESLDAWRTRQYDYYQRVLNGIL